MGNLFMAAIAALAFVVLVALLVWYVYENRADMARLLALSAGDVALMLLLALGGIALSRRYLRHDRSAQALCIVVCALVALACAVYIGLTVLLVAAVQHRPPAL